MGSLFTLPHASQEGAISLSAAPLLQPIQSRRDRCSVLREAAVSSRSCSRHKDQRPIESAFTAAAQRLRTARCNGATPLLSTAFGSAPARSSPTIIFV
jgi:hypothetical protein